MEGWEEGGVWEGGDGEGVVVERGGRWVRWLAHHVGRSWVARFVNIVLFIVCGGMHGDYIRLAHLVSFVDCDCMTFFPYLGCLNSITLLPTYSKQLIPQVFCRCRSGAMHPGPGESLDGCRRQRQRDHAGEDGHPQWTCPVCLRKQWRWRTFCRRCLLFAPGEAPGPGGSLGFGPAWEGASSGIEQV